MGIKINIPGEGSKKEIPAAAAWRSSPPLVSVALATALLYPIETIKVRMQCGQGSGLRIFSNILKNEGTRSFYKGLSGGLLRQAAYSTVFFTSYRRILSASTASSGDIKPQSSHYQKFLCSLAAGAISTLVVCPTDFVVTRMQADATLPAALRRNYRNVFHAFYRVVTDEGILALWKGAGPLILKTMGIMIGAKASSACSNFLKHEGGVSMDQNILVHLFVVGVLPPLCSNPFDYVKTQLQVMRPNANGRYPYTGPLNCALKTLKFGGPLKFYTGFTANCLYSLPHIMLTIALSSLLREGLQLRF